MGSTDTSAETSTDTTVTAVTADRAPRLRADARRNRERIVTAAREMFVEHGVDVPLDDVARRAGVGNATLYRHFPDRAGLVREVVLSVMERVTEGAAAAAAEEADPFAALRRFVHTAADEKVAALCPLLSEDAALSGIDTHPDVVATREHLERVIEAIVDRAHTAGRLRADIGVGDLMMVVTQLTRPLPGTACTVGDRFAHRHLDVLMDGLRNLDPTPLAGAPVSLHDLNDLAGRPAEAAC